MSVATITVGVRMRIIAFLSFFLMFACSNPFQEAKDLNTIEAYEKFIAENGSSSYVAEARMAIEKIMTDKARESQNPADFDAYLDKFEADPPTPALYTKMVDERLEVFWNKAEVSNDPADWQAFIDEYKDDKKSKYMNTNRVKQAETRLTIAEYITQLTIEPVKVKKINLGKQDGPLNGLEFSTTITNSGRKNIEHLNLAISFLDDDGNVVGTQKFNVVGCGKYCDRGKKWIEENLISDPEADTKYPFLPPFKRRSTITFSDTTGDVPPGWSGQLKTTFVGIKFVERRR